MLAAARFQREQLQLVVVAVDQAPEQEAAGGAGDEDVAVEGGGEALGGLAVEPELVAGAIVADAGGDDHRHLARRIAGRHDQAGAAGSMGAA